METKLTLRLKKKIIDRAKKYAGDHQTSLSKMIENYLATVTTEYTDTPETISPLVRSLSGVIQMDVTDNPKEQYHKHLENKYK